jgi:hypothetical protein
MIAPAMDETPEELEQIRREAAQIDPNRYRKRTRAMAAIGVGALGAALVWVVMYGVDQARNPCQRVRDYFCKVEAGSARCQSYESLLRDSVQEPSGEMRGMIRAQCQTKIKRLEEDQGIKVP